MSRTRYAIRCPECDELILEGGAKLIEVDYCTDCGELFPVEELEEGSDGGHYCQDCIYDHGEDEEGAE